MPDPRSVMQEFRFLEQKRQAEGLTADEEVRYGELRDLVGGEASAPKARPGFNVSAAAARLRESLMPAGLRNRPPPAPEPAPEPIGEIEPPAPEPVPEAYAEQPYAPAEQQQASEGFFDPQALAAEGEGAYDPNAAYYDPNAAAYDPNAAAYDPNAAAYDPNAAAYDPNAAVYDPNAAAYDPNAAAYDPNAAAYDPNAAAYDPNAAAYDPNAAAYDPNAAAYDPNAAAYDPNAAAYDPNAAAYDPNAAAYDPSAAAYDPNAAAYDPNAAAYDPNAAAYDPNAAAYDPNAAAYDPNAAAYDPNAAAYDPNAAAYDPNAAAYDPNAAAYDPNAAAYDPNAAPYDPNAPAADSNAAAYDPNAAPYDPNAPAADAGAALTFDTSAPPPEDPNAMGWADASAPDGDAVATLQPVEPEQAEELGPIELDGAAAPAPQEESDWSGVSAELPGEATAPAEGAAWAPTPGGEYDDAAWNTGAASAAQDATQPAAAPALEGDLSPFPPAGWAPEAEPPAAPPGPVEFGGYDDPAPPATAQVQADLEALLPFDPAAEAAVGPDMVDAFAGEGPASLELPAPHDVPDHTGFHASEAMAAQEAPGWQPEPAAVDQGFELASGGSFDASADAAAPEWAAPASAAPWDAGDGEPIDTLPGGTPYDPASHDAGASDPAPAGAASGAALLDYSGGDLTPPEAEGLDVSWASSAAAPAPAPDADAFEVLESPELTQPGFDLTPPTDVPLDLDAPAPPEPAPELDPLPVEDDIPTIEADDLVEAEPMAAPAPVDAPVALEPELPVIDEHVPEPELPVIEEHLPEPAPMPDPVPAYASDPYASAPAPVEPPPEPAPEFAAYAAPAAPVPEEPPLEIIETTPESEVPPPAPEYLIPGVRRVVVHTMEGQVKRGVLEDADLAAPELLLAAVAGGPVEGVPTDHVKAIFFMLAPGESPVTPYGSRVRVTFRDGRPLAGLSPDYRDGAFGFFVIPADPRTSTERIWVYQAAVKQVAVS